jgi:hypothetical protein
MESPMHGPPTPLDFKRIQITIVSVVAIGLAIGGFQAGRKTVNAAAAAANADAPVAPTPPPDPVAQKQTLLERNDSQISVREIATVPFSELYDVLKSAPHEQLLAWARDLEQMPRGPRQRAAVTAYYKSLVQVNHRIALEAILQAQNLLMRDLAVVAVTQAGPESTWGEIAETLNRLPYPRRGTGPEDIIWNWSAVDPVAAAEFITTHPVKDEDRRLYSLFSNWGRIDPVQAQGWLEAHPFFQTREAFSALVGAWADTDRAAAIHYLLANASRPEFRDAIDGLGYNFFLKQKDQATRLMLLLPPEQAKGALQHIAQTTIAVILGLPDDYQRPPEEVARWMTTLPVDLWKDAIGVLDLKWVKEDAAGATNWFDQLQPDLRNAVVAGFCRATDSEAAERALTLGQTITDRKLRDSALGQFARNLGDTRQDAINAVKKLPISEEQKGYLLRVMPENDDGQ